MKDRLRKARRIQAAAAELDKLSKWRLAEAERHAGALEAKVAELTQFLDAGECVGDLFARSIMRRLTSLEKERGRADAEADAGRERRRAGAARLRAAEGLVGELKRAQLRRDEAARLQEAIDASLQQERQASGKLDGSS